MTVDGTSVTAEDTAGGGALVFVTTGDVDVLRARVRGWADAHNQHHGAMGPLPTGDETGGGGHDHGGGGGGGDAGHAGHAGHGGHGGGGGASSSSWHTMIGVHSRAAAGDIDGGARLEWISFPAQIGAMRDELRGHAQHLSGGTCAMSSGS